MTKLQTLVVWLVTAGYFLMLLLRGEDVDVVVFLVARGVAVHGAGMKLRVVIF